jgi:hypothetical protein
MRFMYPPNVVAIPLDHRTNIGKHYPAAWVELTNRILLLTNRISLISEKFA